MIPVGPTDHQQLVRLTRVSERNYEEEKIGDVRFVPLIGAHGWAEEARASARPPQTRKSIPTLIREAAEPVPDIDDATFAPLFDRFAGARVVLLGEASHGTSEFYRARAAVTRHLITHHGFTIVAVEADWPDAAVIDRHVRGLPQQAEAEPPFRRFPTWMWRNAEMNTFLRWLMEHNRALPPAQRAGFSTVSTCIISAVRSRP